MLIDRESKLSKQKSNKTVAGGWESGGKAALGDFCTFSIQQ